MGFATVHFRKHPKQSGETISICFPRPPLNFNTKQHAFYVVVIVERFPAGAEPIRPALPREGGHRRAEHGEGVLHPPDGRHLHLDPPDEEGADGAGHHV